METDDAISEDGGGLIIEEGVRSGMEDGARSLDMEDKEYGETLDLSKRKAEEYRPPQIHRAVTLQTNLGSGSPAGHLVQTTGTLPGHLVQTTLPLIATHITSTRVLEGLCIH